MTDDPVVGAFSPISLLAYGDAPPVSQILVPFHNVMTLDTHESAKELICSRL